MDNDKRKEIETNSINLATAIIAKTTFHNNGMWFDDALDRQTLDNIIEYAVKKTLEVYKKIENQPMEVYCEDLVVLSIDGGEPIRYYLTEYKHPEENKTVSWGKGNTATYIYMGALEKPGYLLIGKYVGDTITYSNDDEKSEHTIKILSTKRTELSEKLMKDDLACYYPTKNKQNSK